MIEIKFTRASALIKTSPSSCLCYLGCLSWLIRCLRYLTSELATLVELRICWGELPELGELMACINTSPGLPPAPLMHLAHDIDSNVT